MTIDEAIERLIIVKEGWPLSDSENYYKAVQLGLEALKAIKLTRENPKLGHIVYLAGETEE